MSAGTRVRRSVQLPAPPTESDRIALTDWPGMGSVECRGRRLVLCYDAADVQWSELHPWLVDRLGLDTSGILVRLKLAWYRFVDGNARANAQSRGGHCCNKPPPTPNRRR